MEKHNPDNERIKWKYFAYLKEARGQNEATVDAVAKALARFEADTKCRDFKLFQNEQAIAFKKHLSEQNSKTTGEKLSKATLHSTLGNLKQFFQWLYREPGYRSRFRYSDADYFSLSRKDNRVATAHRVKAYPTLEQVKHVIETMLSGSEIEQRDRAIVAFTLLTAARDGAIASMKLKHLRLESHSVFQDAHEVKTKFAKSFPTFFFPVGDDILKIFTDWMNYLRQVKLWGNDDPLFPKTEMVYGKNQKFEVAGLKREHWSDASPIRTIFKEAFIAAGLTYFNPHTLRNTLTSLGKTICKTPEEFKAWSQNLGHDKVMTTFSIYGAIEDQRQGEIIRGLGKSKPQESTHPDVAEFAKAVLDEMAARNELAKLP